METTLVLEDVSKAQRKGLSVRIPTLVRLFYEAQGKFVRDCSLTQAMERFLIDRAGADENIKAIATAIEIEATMSGQPPKQVIKSFLDEKGYGGDFDTDKMADALIKAWKMDAPNAQ